MIPQIRDFFGGDAKKARRFIKEENKKYPAHLIPINAPHGARKIPKGYIGSLRSRDFLVQIVEIEGVTRLTINRADIDSAGNWKDGITWDDIQRLKREAGFGECFAVECYPEDEHIVYDANMRHIFILKERPAYAWTKENRHKQ